MRNTQWKHCNDSVSELNLQVGLIYSTFALVPILIPNEFSTQLCGNFATYVVGLRVTVGVAGIVELCARDVKMLEV